MTTTTGRTTRVIGWYHSHPHITVLPSHVDVRTQAMYQLLDPGFIGLIFSCFSEDAQKVGRIQVIAFQSLNGKQRHTSPIANSSIIEVESSSSYSDNVLSASTSALAEHSEPDTGDSQASRAAKRMRDENALVLYDANNAHNLTADVDSPDMTPSMQEALHRSNLDVSGAEYVRKEVPLQVLPARYLLELDSPLKSFADMQHVLFGEEQSAYNQAIFQSLRDGKIHPFTFVHHTSTYQASLCKLMEYCLSPAVSALQDRLKENETRLVLLVEEAKSLEIEALAIESGVKTESSCRMVGGSPALGQREMHPSSDSPSARSPTGVSSRRKAA